MTVDLRQRGCWIEARWWGNTRGRVGACVTQDLGFYVVVRSHGGTGTAVEKQPAAAPAHTVTPLRRRLAALGRSSLRRSSAHTVFRMAMRRSNLSDTTPKFLIDPARNSIGGNVIEDTSRRATIATELPDHRQHARGRDSACSISIVDRRKLIVSRTRDVEGTTRSDARSSSLANSTSSVDAFAEKIYNRTNITLHDSNKHTRKWRIRNKLTVVVPVWSTEYPLCNILVASSKQCRDNNIFGEIAGSTKLSAGVVKQAPSTVDRRSVGRNSVNTTLAENSVYTAAAIVSPIDLVSNHVTTIAHAPRTCYVSHAGGPTHGPPIAPQLDDRVSVTLDFHASAGLPAYQPATIQRNAPLRSFSTNVRRYALSLSSRVRRACQAGNRAIDRVEFSRKSGETRSTPTVKHLAVCVA